MNSRKPTSDNGPHPAGPKGSAGGFSIMTPRDDDFAGPTAFRLGTAFRPYVGQREFRDAMAAFGTTVCLVTAGTGAGRLGRTVTSVFSLSVDPPSILISIDISSDLADAIAGAYGFSFAMLSQAQRDVADAFAGRREPEERFEAGSWSEWPSGHPRLAGAVVAMDCDLIGTMETETHRLFAGGVTGIETDPGRLPLIWHRRAYKPLL